jgi:hypothetical protein
MWETNHEILFQSTVEWLDDSSVQGVENGTPRLGD